MPENEEAEFEEKDHHSFGESRADRSRRFGRSHQLRRSLFAKSANPTIPKPEDRIWRHPAEVAAEERAFLASITEAESSSATNSPVAAAAVAVFGGGLLITGLWLAMGSTASAPVASAGAGLPLSEDPAAGGITSLPTPVADSTVEILAADGDLVGFGIAIHSGDQIMTATEPTTASVDVVLSDGTTMTASFVGRDELSGLTALRLPSAVLTPAALGTVTPTELAGSVAGTGASSRVSLVTVPGQSQWSHAVFEMNSKAGHLGSPVVDTQGDVVGLVTGYDKTSTQITSIAVVERVAAQLFESGEADHPWLGIEGHDFPEGDAALITEVTPDGPADIAGLKPDDRVLVAESHRINSMPELLSALRMHNPGDTMVLLIESNGTKREVSVELGRVADA